MTDSIKVGALCFALGLLVAALAARVCYNIGFEHGTDEAAAQQAAAIDIVRKEEKQKYEKAIDDLVTARDHERQHYAERLRELEQFRRAGTDLESCRSDRSRLASIAVGFESVAVRAIDSLKATLEQRKD